MRSSVLSAGAIQFAKGAQSAFHKVGSSSRRMKNRLSKSTSDVRGASSDAEQLGMTMQYCVVCAKEILNASVGGTGRWTCPWA
mmetsp:Transcript_19919/g.48774  ORF Transcript_19919/g.48774 Transcript_19919/m.48774 type:complete len:83 (+) Transcript_19919:1380-1628(+)